MPVEMAAVCNVAVVAAIAMLSAFFMFAYGAKSALALSGELNAMEYGVRSVW